MNHVWNISSKSLIHRKSVQENKNILHRSKAHGLSKIHIWKNWELHRRNSFTKRFELQKIRYHKKPSFYDTSPKIWQMKTTRYQKSITRWTEDECSWMKCDVTELNALFVNKEKAGLRCAIIYSHHLLRRAAVSSAKHSEQISGWTTEN